MHEHDVVLITGATGAVGGELCRRLAGSGAEVRGATRDPTRASSTGVPVRRWVRLDYDDPEGFDGALDGVDALFLIARPGDEDPAGAARPLLEAARTAGVQRVVNLTALGAERRDDVTLGRVERLVEESGFAFTHLRPNWFMQIFSTGPLLAGLRAAGRIAVPAGEARISFVDARDVAAVAARTLLEHGHEGRAYDLTGPRSLSHAEIAEALARESGRPVDYVPLDEDEARAAIHSAGLGPERTNRLIRFYRLVRAGHSAPVSHDIESVLGRPPTSFARFARDHAEIWTTHPPAGVRAVPTS